MHRVHAAVVELDPLPDAVRTAAEDDDLALARVGLRLALGLVRRVEVRRVRHELGGARVDARVDGARAPARGAARARRPRSRPLSAAIWRSLKPRRLYARSCVGRRSRRASRRSSASTMRRICARNQGSMAVSSWSSLVGEADAHRVGDVEEAVGRRRRRRASRARCASPRASRGGSARGRLDVGRLHRRGRAAASGSASSAVVDAAEQRHEPVLARLERARRLLQRLAERAPDAHHLADALHLRAERRVGAGELLEGEARPLDDDVVDDRLERGARPRDVVLELVERVADGELRGDLRDGVARRLARERATSATRAGSSR